jgi:hypothetical protein
MKISNIFAIKTPHLYAVQYGNEEFNEWRRLFKMWNNQEYLRSFLKQNHLMQKLYVIIAIISGLNIL